MSDFRVVPDVLRERDPIRRGRPPASPIARALLSGQTIFIAGDKKGWGNLYKLAKSNNKKARTKGTEINGERGTLIWFEDIFEGQDTQGGPKATNNPPPPPPKDRG